MGLYTWDWNGECDYPRVPPGLKNSVNDPMAVTREVKKAATFFGASLVGTCRLDRRWLYSSVYLITPEGNKSIPNEIPDACDAAIVIAVVMDYQ